MLGAVKHSNFKRFKSESMIDWNCQTLEKDKGFIKNSLHRHFGLIKKLNLKLVPPIFYQSSYEQNQFSANLIKFHGIIDKYCVLINDQVLSTHIYQLDRIGTVVSTHTLPKTSFSK